MEYFPPQNIDTGWIDYTPSWIGSTSNPVINNGTLSASYKVTGNPLNGYSMAVRILVLMGSTTTYGSGEYFFSLPTGITVDNSKIKSVNVGTAFLIDNGTGANRQMGTVTRRNANLNHLLINLNGSANNVSNNLPFTWAQDDSIYIATYDFPILGY